MDYSLLIMVIGGFVWWKLVTDKEEAIKRLKVSDSDLESMISEVVEMRRQMAFHIPNRTCLPVENKLAIVLIEMQREVAGFYNDKAREVSNGAHYIKRKLVVLKQSSSYGCFNHEEEGYSGLYYECKKEYERLREDQYGYFDRDYNWIEKRFKEVGSINNL